MAHVHPAKCAGSIVRYTSTWVKLPSGLAKSVRKKSHVSDVPDEVRQPCGVRPKSSEIAGFRPISRRKRPP